MGDSKVNYFISKMKYLIAAVLLLLSSLACAFDGLVVQVHDGDTLTVRNELGVSEKIRLYRVDSPEMKYSGVPYQPYASEARTGLLNLCLGKVATIVRKGKSYSRTVGSVSCSGVDAATWQVVNGNAWVYRYTGTVALRKLQAQAKLAGSGLWSLPTPIEPYLWRRKIYTM